MKTRSQTKNPREGTQAAAGLTRSEGGVSEREGSDPKGVNRDGEVYCCEGCGGGTGCACEDQTA